MKKLLFLLWLISIPALAQDLFPLHSHNDYQQKHPFRDAHAHHFQSVEADIWLSFWGELKVAHWPWQNKGTLEQIYLLPTQEHVDHNLFPYWVRTPFLLWIDIKDPRKSMLRKLARMLEKEF